MVYKLNFPHVIVFSMYNYNHNVGFHVGIKGKASHAGLARIKVEAILGGKGGNFYSRNGGVKKVDSE